MTDNRTISLCLTTFNRWKMLIESFAEVLHDRRVSEIIIVDDHSDLKHWEMVNDIYDTSGEGKIKKFRNTKNLGCYKNKREAISKASNEYVIIFDSDNILTTEYIDRIFEQEWNRDTVLAPDFAKPHFDYTAFSGLTVSKENVKEMMLKKNFEAMINTMNYFVHRDEYLKVWVDHKEPWTADTAFQNYNWLKAGNKIKVVKGMQYEHRIEHTEHKSHYQEHNRKTGNMFNDVMDKMRALR
jgi:glycosyltransferase involved in cell wall biosynthesis